MKRILAGISCLFIFLFGSVVYGESNPFLDFDDGTPHPEITSEEEGFIEIAIDGKTIHLAFDSSEDYSSVSSEGLVQASFYAYSDNSAYLYEFYMFFPDYVQSGDVITPEEVISTIPDCSVALIISSYDSEDFYFAGEVNGAVFPIASSFKLAFDSVIVDGSLLSYSGHLTAHLGKMGSGEDDGSAVISIENAPFRFAMTKNEDSDSNIFDVSPAPAVTPRPFDATTPLPESTSRVWRI